MVTLRIVTWNMGCGWRGSKYRKRHAAAWDYLLQELRPDIALLQECLLSMLRDAPGASFTQSCDAGKADAGTGIITWGVAASRAVAPTFPTGTYAVYARLGDLPRPIAVLSVHTYPGNGLHDDLASLTRWLPAAPEAIVAGDFNAARALRKKHPAFFAGMRDAGFADAHWHQHEREVRSFWGHQAVNGYQCDHFFVSHALLAGVRRCDVIDCSETRELSDHGPLVLELALEDASHANPAGSAAERAANGRTQS